MTVMSCACVLVRFGNVIALSSLVLFTGASCKCGFHALEYHSITLADLSVTLTTSEILEETFTYFVLLKPNIGLRLSTQHNQTHPSCTICARKVRTHLLPSTATAMAASPVSGRSTKDTLKCAHILQPFRTSRAD
jgi:hypothetical protein